MAPVIDFREIMDPGLQLAWRYPDALITTTYPYPSSLISSTLSNSQPNYLGERKTESSEPQLVLPRNLEVD